MTTTPTTPAKANPPQPSNTRRWSKRLGWAGALLTVLGSALLLDACAALGGSPKGDRLERITSSPQYGDGKFENKLKVQDPEILKTLGKWIAGAENTAPAESQSIPVQERKTSDFSAPPKSGLRMTWLGHSSFLIEVDGYKVLTDPVWGERASPSSFMGPKRFYEAPISLEDLPKLDAVLISHDHYDHLDEPSIRRLKEIGVNFFVPLGIGAHLEHWGVPSEKIVELDWWERANVGGLELVCTPSRHFSGRFLFDRNATLWSSWAVLGPTHRVYFSGDSGMFPGFKDIGDRLGPFDATLMEVGAYNSLWADVHMGPEQATLAHKLLQGKVMFPVHWGTFDLALHSWAEPIERLMVSTQKEGIKLVVPRPGQSIEPAHPPAIARWWPEMPWQSAKEAPVVSSKLPENMQVAPNLSQP